MAHATPSNPGGDSADHAGARALVATSVPVSVDLAPRGHDPSFLTHLIAVAEHCPQTRVLRRASPQDAMAAYRATDRRDHTRPLGVATRQKI